MKKGIWKTGLVLGVCMGLVLAIGGCGAADSEEDLTQQEQGTDGEGATDPATDGEDSVADPAVEGEEGMEENAENPA